MYSNSNCNGEICQLETTEDVEVEKSESANKSEHTVLEAVGGKEGAEIITQTNNSLAELVESKDLSTGKPHAIELKIITTTFMPVAEANK